MQGVRYLRALQGQRLPSKVVDVKRANTNKNVAKLRKQRTKANAEFARAWEKLNRVATDARKKEA